MLVCSYLGRKKNGLVIYYHASCLGRPRPLVFVVVRLERLFAPPCVLIFHQGLLNSEEGSLPPTSSQTNCLRDCRGGSEADGWAHKDLTRPYLQTLNPYFPYAEAAWPQVTGSE